MDKVFAAAISSLQTAETRFSAAAIAVSEAPTETSDLAAASVEMIQAKTQYEFGVELVKVSTEMMDTLLAIQAG